MVRAALGIVAPGLDDLRCAYLNARGRTDAHRHDVMRHWLPLPDDPAAPHATVILGARAQRMFVAMLLPRLRDAGVRTRFVGLAHPSSAKAFERLDHDAVAESMRPLDDGFGAWRYQNGTWSWHELDHPSWSPPSPVAMPGAHLRAFVATRPEDVPCDSAFASVDGSVPGASATWDHHVSGERINLDAMPPRVDPRAFAAVGTTLADTDALVSVVALRAGGECSLPEEVRLVLRAASERCDHLVPLDGAAPPLQRAGDALHRYVELHLSRAGAVEQSEIFSRLCDQVTRALARGTPLPGAGANPHVAGLQRRIRREDRIDDDGRVSCIDVRGLPDVPADALHELHEAPVAVIVRDHPHGGIAYTVGVRPAAGVPPPDLTAALRALAAQEHAMGPPALRLEPGPGSENWGGRRTVFGSPWNYGSRLQVSAVVGCVRAWSEAR
jgi:hypothetical protein